MSRTNAREIRNALLHTIDGVINGQVSTHQAEAVASLSSEYRASVQQEWDMAKYMHTHMGGKLKHTAGLLAGDGGHNE
jgi:hypothetical protein